MCTVICVGMKKLINKPLHNQYMKFNTTRQLGLLGLLVN